MARTDERIVQDTMRVFVLAQKDYSAPIRISIVLTNDDEIYVKVGHEDHAELLWLGKAETRKSDENLRRDRGNLRTQQGKVRVSIVIIKLMPSDLPRCSGFCTHGAPTSQQSKSWPIPDARGT